jgi:hypothetical protein
MTWTYLPADLDEFFAGVGRPRKSGGLVPEPFDRPANVHAVESKSGLRVPIEG